MSPYLPQHAGNPVHWREWSTAALDEVRRRGVPVLLAVGYSACHWCHLMAHESLEDPATAELMNRHFVSIKVEREETAAGEGAYYTWIRSEIEQALGNDPDLSDRFCFAYGVIQTGNFDGRSIVNRLPRNDENRRRTPRPARRASAIA